MKDTVFSNIHRTLGARMVPFAGYNMPVEYSGINDEHLTVRNRVGVFDVSHMGEIWVKGPGSLDFLQKVTTNDVSVLKPGKCQYTCLPNGKGGIVDDLLIYKYDDNKYMLVVNASNIEKDWKWLNGQNSGGVELENASDKISQLAVQGPFALKALQKLTEVNLANMKPFTFITTKLAGSDNVIIATTGYTGAGGFEIYFYNNVAEKIWDAIFMAGAQYGIKPIGLAARDTLRLEMGYCLYGNDIDDTTSPIEAGLGWITKFSEYKNQIDKELLLRQKKEGVSRTLVGFEMIEKAIPRHGYEICDGAGTLIGKVTSGTMSPCLKAGIGMGYVKTEFSNPGSEIYIRIRNKLIKSKVVGLPFVKQ